MTAVHVSAPKGARFLFLFTPQWKLRYRWDCPVSHSSTAGGNLAVLLLLDFGRGRISRFSQGWATHIWPRFAGTEHSLRRISLWGLTSWPVFRNRAEMFPSVRTVKVKESRLKCLLALDSLRFKRLGVFFCWWDDKKPGECERADWGEKWISPWLHPHR